MNELTEKNDDELWEACFCDTGNWIPCSREDAKIFKSSGDYEVRKKKFDQCCADCGLQIGKDDGPPDGWQLEDGRTVCHACCVDDTRRVSNGIIQTAKSIRGRH